MKNNTKPMSTYTKLGIMLLLLITLPIWGNLLTLIIGGCSLLVVGIVFVSLGASAYGTYRRHGMGEVS